MTAFADIAGVLDEVWGALWTPRSRQAVDEWADENRELSDKSGALAGRWCTDRTPYLREPMRLYTDPSVRVITIMASAQVGKTECWTNCLLHTIDCEPVPSLIVFPDEKMAKSAMKDRVLPAIRATPATARRLTGAQWDETSKQVNLDAMTIWMGWSHSRASVATRPIGRLFLDEIDEYAQGSDERARQRTQTFLNHKIVETSTPTYEGVGIHKRYMEGDQRTWHWPCPHCGSYQRWRFDRVRWDTPEQRGKRATREVSISPDLAEKLAHYVCEKCEGVITDGMKSSIQRRGVWLLPGQVCGAGADGAPVITEADGSDTASRPRSSHASFAIPGLASPWVTFGKLAREFVQQGCEPSMDWINGKLGEPWRTAGQRAEDYELVRIAEQCAPPYELGSAPPGSLLLTGAIDVQADRAYYEVVAWGYDGVETAALVDCGVVDCPQFPSEDFAEDSRRAGKAKGAARGLDVLEREALDAFAQVVALLDAQYPLLAAGGGSGRTIGVSKWGIDAGFRTTEVMLLGRLYFPHLQPLIGRTRNNIATAAPLAESVYDRLPDGRPLRGGVMLLSLNTDWWKDYVFSRMWRPQGMPGAWAWPRNLPAAYARQMTAEERVIKQHARGADQPMWVKRPNRQDNHWWDCRVYNAALFEHHLKRAVKDMALRGGEPGAIPQRSLPSRLRF